MGNPLPADPPPSPDPAEEGRYAIRTWHYLRLAMVALVLGLLAAVLYEHAQVHCFQGSISAYWYTPARGYFVAVLLGMSVCMVCLRSKRTAENILLNYAGLLAPVVAFASTPPEHPTPEHPLICVQATSAVHERSADIANNCTALFALGGAALAIALLISLVGGERPRGAELWAAVGGFALWLAALLVFVLARHFFEANAHITAAPAMFLCIVAVVGYNAFGSKPEPGHRVLSYRNIYVAIAIGMFGTLAVAVFGSQSPHATIWVEVALISLFAIFWALQTVELWDRGLRREGEWAKSS